MPIIQHNSLITNQMVHRSELHHSTGRYLPFIKNGRRILYARSDVLAYLEQNRAQRTHDPRGAGAA
jgi:hypothetical protein